MPKEVVEHFLMANKDLLEKREEYMAGLEYDEEEIEGEEEMVDMIERDQNQGIDSSEMIVENEAELSIQQNEQEDAMII